MTKILLVDDQANVVSALARVLRRDWGDSALIETHTAPLHAIQRASETQFEVAIVDYHMPEMDGLAFLAKFRELQPYTSRIILSGMTDIDVLTVAINDIGISKFIPKPWDDIEFATAVRNAISATFARREEHRLAEAHRGAVDPTRRASYVEDLKGMEPGLLNVKWGPNGEVLLDEE